jgi:glyoxylase-like metal-dependent hydrolase (beta-lactamase superfamily II)
MNHTTSRAPLLAAATLILALPALAQFGPPPPPQNGPKLAMPRVYPAPDTYPTTESVTLIAPEDGAQIRYTWDGSAPTAQSPLWDPQRLLFITGVYEGERGLKTGYTIRAITTMPDHKDSDIATFQYVIDRPDRAAYRSEQIFPGVWMVRDSDNDKMFLIRGTKKCVLVDSGQGHGNLKEYLAQFTGGLPIEVVFTHNHGDHIGQADQFIADSIEHIGAADRDTTVRLLKSRNATDAQIEQHLLTLQDGERIDLGDRTLVAYATPGHTPGSSVLLDERNGYLFSGDSFGSNSPIIPDAFWLQGNQQPLDGFMAMIKFARERLHGRVKYLMSGHNDKPLAGETYLGNIETALQRLMDRGEATLIPSYRPAGFKQVVVGDRYTDPDWVAINVNVAKFLPAPVDGIAGLAHIKLEGAALTGPLEPRAEMHEAVAAPKTNRVRVTPVPTSTRAQAVRVNGRMMKPGEAFDARVGSTVKIEIASPDGSAHSTHQLKILPAR